jgi:phosphoribosylpyrophosphate synthetase
MRTAYAILAGTANPTLAGAIAESLGIQLNPCHIERFPDGEVGVQIQAPVRDKVVFLLQPTSPPVNDHLIELLALADACRRAAAAHIKALVPYFGYARADKRRGRREPITARMVADVMESVGIDQVDDMIATGGTIVESVRVLRKAGAAAEILVAGTHGLFIEHAREKIAEAGVRKVFITDTVPQAASTKFPLQVVSIASLLAAAIQRLVADGSISDLHSAENH